MATQPKAFEIGVITTFGRTAGWLRAENGELVSIDMVHAKEEGQYPQQGDKIRFRREIDDEGSIAVDWEFVFQKSESSLV